MGEIQPLIPEWTEEDFDSEKPYEWLYRMRDANKFLFMQLLNKTMKRAAAVGVSSVVFKQFWKAYVEAMSPKTSVLGANVTDFPGQPKELQCGAYRCDMDGVKYFGRMGEEIDVIRHPIIPVKRIVDVDSNEQRLQLAYCRMEAGGKAEWKTMIVNRDVLASAQKIIALARNGIAVTSENAKEVVKYLSELESMNYTEMDSQESTSHMGWLPNGEFAPYADQIVFGGDSEEFSSIYGRIREHGDEGVWMELARRVRSGKSVPARIALAASFAAPLVSKLGALCFFVHFWGLQGSGKSVGLMLAASVWGDPVIGNYIKTFHNTKVGQEQMAVFCGNLPVMFDELQVVADRRQFDDIIYTMCEGVSKGRGAKEGGLQASRRWSTVFLTTGEMPIVQSNSGGGAAVRVIEVNYGGEPFFWDAREVANTLRDNYGFAGRKFIEALKEPDTMDQLKEVQNMYYNKLSGSIQDKQTLSASILLAADKLASVCVFDDDRALTVEDIKPYLITQDQADVNRRCYTWLVGWIAANQKRFSSDLDDNNGEPWGVSEKEGNRELVYIIRGTFEKALGDAGFSPGAFLSWAKRMNLLKTARYDNNTIQKTIGSMRPTCVAVYMQGEEIDQQEKQEKFVQVDEEMPF